MSLTNSMELIRVMPSPRGYTWVVAPGGVAKVSRQITSTSELSEQEVGYMEASGLTRVSESNVFHATVLTATDCNLGCGYCFQNTGVNPDRPFAPDRIPGTKLDPSTVDDIALFIKRAVVHANASSISMVLFGGEPLLDFDSCLRVLDTTQEVAPVEAVMVTNGVLMTPGRAARLEETGLRAVQVTLDGDRKRHDATRHTRNGRGTYDLICQNIAGVQESTSVAICLRVNILPDDPDSYVKMLLDIAGKVDPQQTFVDLSPVRDYSWNESSALRDGSARDLIKSLVEIAEVSKRLGFRLARPASRFCPFCSIADGKRGAVIGPDGSLYSSWQAAGRPEFRLGNVRDGYIQSVIEDRWVTCRQFDARSCSEAGDSTWSDYFDGAIMDLTWDLVAAPGQFH
ncbi:radical SAM protein [Cellulomonas bogoriensis]|uniref:radical SAM protein n=1 Tax=Cellulomonas bogoriensis TaxID=301388 RepID=UPI000A05A29B|nr:radical SAM protein [Cellulomonas bogoriensis]